MRVFGGFAQHGYRHGISIDGQTLVRRCDDCGHEWSAGVDAETRASAGCACDRESSPSDESRERGGRPVSTLR
jgi:hypothetical protein